MVQTRGRTGRPTLRVRWGRVGVAALLLFVTAWIGAAGVLYFFFKHKHDFAEVTFPGMVALPFRLDEHREEMGRYHVEEGLKAVSDGDLGRAIQMLRVGLLRAPDHLEGRQVLAELFEVVLRRPGPAAEALTTGLPHGGADDADYIRRTLQLLSRYQMDDEVQTIADEYLDRPGNSTELNQLLAFGAARANHFRGNYDRAEQYLRGYNLLSSVEGILTSAQISWDRGQRAAAIGRLEESLTRFGNSEAIFLQLSRYHREEGRIDTARRYAVLRNISSPLSVAPRIELLYIYHATDDEERVQRESRQILQQFRNDEDAILQLANYAADTGNYRLARRTYQLALENEFNLSSFALLLIESHLVAEDYEAAIGFTEELAVERPDWLNTRQAVFSSLRAVASYALGRDDLGQNYLQDFIRAENTRVETFLAVSRRLEQANRPREAQRVLRTAFSRNPNNQSALSELIRIELELGNANELPALLRQLIRMRRPSIDLIARAYRELGSDRFIFAEDRETLLMELSTTLREANATVPGV